MGKKAKMIEGVGDFLRKEKVGMDVGGVACEKLKQVLPMVAALALAFNHKATQLEEVRK